jgi:hypothetical protein
MKTWIWIVSSNSSMTSSPVAHARVSRCDADSKLAEDAVEERDQKKREERPRRSYMQDAIFGFEQLRGD